MAAIPVRKPVIPITNRETAFDSITALHKEFLDINGQTWSEDEKNEIEILLKNILTDLASAHRELQKYPAAVFVPTLKGAPSLLGKKGKQAAQAELKQFQDGHLEHAKAFKKALYDGKERFTEQQKATAERQYQDFDQEDKRLKDNLKNQESPMKYLALLAQSKVPKNNYLQIGSTKFYMKEDIQESTGIPIFKAYFFKKDEGASDADNDLKLAQVKSIFQKVFTSSKGEPLSICDRIETGLLEESLNFYLDKLRTELQAKQSERGTNAIPVRTLLVKVEDSKFLIDTLLAKQLDICRKGQKEPEPEPQVGSLGPDEIKRILRKVVLILAAKQKQVVGYEKHSKLAEQLLALLSPASLPNVENANIPKIEKNFQDVLQSTRTLKMLYELGKGGPDELVERIEKGFALQLLKKLEPLIASAPHLTPVQKAAITTGIDFTSIATAKDHIELLQKRLLDLYTGCAEQMNKLEAELKTKTIQLAKCADLDVAFRKLQGEYDTLKAAGGETSTLRDEIKALELFQVSLEADKRKLEGEKKALEDEQVRLRQQIVDLNANLKACNDEKERFQKTIDDLRVDLARKDQERLDALDLAEQQKQKELAAKNTALAAKDAERASALTDQEARLKSSHAAELARKNTERVTALTDQEARLKSEHAIAIAAKDAEIKRLQDNQRTLQLTINDLGERLKNFDGLPLDIKSQLKALQDENKALNDQITKLKQDIPLLPDKKQTEALRGQLAAAESAKKALEDEQKRLLEEIRKRVPTATSLVDGLLKLNDIQANLQKRIDDCERLKREQEEKYQKYIVDIAEASGKIRNATKSSNLPDTLLPAFEAGLPAKPIQTILKRVRELLDRPSASVPGPKSPGPSSPRPTVPGPTVPGADFTYRGLNFYCQNYKYKEDGTLADNTDLINKLRNTMPDPPFKSADREIVRRQLFDICGILPVEGAPVSSPIGTIRRPIGTSGAIGTYVGRGGTRKHKKASEKKTRKIKH